MSMLKIISSQQVAENGGEASKVTSKTKWFQRFRSQEPHF